MDLEAKPVVPADPEVVFTLGDCKAKAGSRVSVELSVASDVVINSIALYNLTYDTASLKLTGFTADSKLMEEYSLFDEIFDEEKNVITIALIEDMVLSGVIGTLEFEVLSDAPEGTASVSMDTLVKFNTKEIVSAMEDAEITVYHMLTGDITGGGELDINDARYLFQHAMMPEIYPIEYTGNLDFTKDGFVDIRDALLLFQHTMLPDLYPID